VAHEVLEDVVGVDLSDLPAAHPVVAGQPQHEVRPRIRSEERFAQGSLGRWARGPLRRPDRRQIDGGVVVEVPTALSPPVEAHQRCAIRLLRLG